MTSTPDRVNAAFAELMKGMREQTGLSPADYAETLGISESYLNDLESGEWGATLSSILRIARALHVAPETLVTATIERLPAAFSATFNRPKSRLYRFAYVDAAGVTHETDDAPYRTVDAAHADLPTKKASRLASGQPPISGLSIYAPIGYMEFPADTSASPSREG